MNETKDSRKIFISHTHEDKALADAFERMVTELFSGYVKVAYSSNPELGPKHGARWLQWIEREVKVSDFALVLLTPSALQKPWILWEAGAVAGTAIAGEGEERRVRSLVFRVPVEQIPDPFRDIQLLHGDNEPEMESMLYEWMNTLPAGISGKAGARLKDTLRKYFTDVNSALDTAPLVATEAVVQEWSIRLEQLGVQRRMSEVRTLHDWLNIAFGRQRDDKRPLDMRLHRRLGELYLQEKNYEEAAEQFELARQISPRDILILRQLGRAYMGLAEKGSEKASQEVQKIMEAIEKLDGKAFERNVECAALKGRWLRQRDPDAAREVYRKAFQNNLHSYYMGDVLGQMELQLGQKAAAEKTYRQVLKIIDDNNERNLWAQATSANASIVLGEDPSVVHKKLEGILRFHPTPGRFTQY